MKDYSGSAFPNKASPEEVAERGMTLRDYFAAKALQGAIADPNVNPATPDGQAVFAEFCYQLADAMLSERAK